MASVSKIQLQSPSTQLTAATTNSSSQVLELFSAAFVGWFKATAVHAATTVNAKIQHSANGTDWTDVCTFSALVGVNGFEAKQIIDFNILPYVRAVTALSGATLEANVDISLYYDKLK